MYILIMGRGGANNLMYGDISSFSSASDAFQEKDASGLAELFNIDRQKLLEDDDYAIEKFTEAASTFFSNIEKDDPNRKYLIDPDTVELDRSEPLWVPSSAKQKEYRVVLRYSLKNKAFYGKSIYGGQPDPTKLVGSIKEAPEGDDKYTISRILSASNDMLNKKRRGRSSSSAYQDKNKYAEAASTEEVANTIRQIITTAINR
jgi:hypothetical protein